jgi:membrane protein implicated in regulation of membrane protease activity
MTANAADFGSAALSAFLRAVGLVALAIGAALAVVFAFFAAMVVGLMIAGAALSMRFWPARRREKPSTPGVLEARRTPDGWVVETATTRK